MLRLVELGRAGSPAEITGPLVVGRIRVIEELPNLKKPVRYAHVDTGDQHVRGIVCAATNFVEGDLVVVALPGTSFGSGLTIEARKTYGRLSEGMMCSPRELGVSDDHSTILVLPAGSASPGDPVSP